MRSNPPSGDVEAFHQRSRVALQQGREQEAFELWRRIVELAPDDARANLGLGQLAYREGDLDRALDHFGRVVRADGRDPAQWINLALVHQRRRDAQGEEEALYQALQRDPQNLPALLLRGQLYERQGRSGDAARAYGAAATVAPPDDRLSPDLRAAVAHAASYRSNFDAQLAAFVDERMEQVLREHAGEDLERFRLSLDILLGRKRRFDSQPMRYFVPRLQPVEFFDRGLFPWLEPLEAATEQIRDEFLALLRADAGFTPYIEYGLDQPVAQWAELNHNPAWSCYHLWKDGSPVEGHVEQCPRTMQAIDRAPRPRQAGRTPVAMFSLLKPRTHIPPHVGASNSRLLCHLPLIVPPHCSFRVGNSVRQWQPGRAWVFDDTIEHEARNDSDQLRVILIFDVWHPGLTEAERRLISVMNDALNEFSGADAGFTA